MRLQPFVYIAGVIILLYVLRVTFVVDIIHSGMETWNYFVDFILNMRDKQPLAFILLPIVLVLLMKGK